MSVRRLSTSWIVVLLLLWVAMPSLAQPGGGAGSPSFSASGSGGVSVRDNTRAYGTVFNHQGQPLGKVDIWVMNDNAPADRVRAKNRSTGAFQVRNVGRLFNEDDVFGIILRMRFEAPGYRTVEIKVPVEKNELAWSYPILWPEDGDPESATGHPCMVKGKVTNAKGKPVRDAAVRVLSPSEELLVEATTAKDGTYEALVWDAPEQMKVEVSGGAGDLEEWLTVSGEPRADLVSVVQGNLSY